MTRYVRRADVSATAVDDEAFLVHPESQEIVHLDALAFAVWRLLEAPHGEDEILEAFTAAFPDVPGQQLAADLKAAIRTLTEVDVIRLARIIH